MPIYWDIWMQPIRIRRSSALISDSSSLNLHPPREAADDETCMVGPEYASIWQVRPLHTKPFNSVADWNGEGCRPPPTLSALSNFCWQLLLPSEVKACNSCGLNALGFWHNRIFREVTQYTCRSVMQIVIKGEHSKALSERFDQKGRHLCPLRFSPPLLKTAGSATDQLQ